MYGIYLLTFKVMWAVLLFHFIL